MKRLLVFLMIGAVMLLTVGCGEQPAEEKTDEPTAAPETQLHTVPPTEELPVEWAPVDCDISLESSEYVFVGSDDFLTFALIGSSDDDCALRFALSEAATEMVSQQDTATNYYLTVNDKVLKGTVAFNDDFSELTLTGGYSYSELCALASEIRGL